MLPALSDICIYIYIYEIYERGRVKPVLRGHLWDKEKMVL